MDATEELNPKTGCDVTASVPMTAFMVGFRPCPNCSLEIGESRQEYTWSESKSFYRHTIQNHVEATTEGTSLRLSLTGTPIMLLIRINARTYAHVCTFIYRLSENVCVCVCVCVCDITYMVLHGGSGG